MKKEIRDIRDCMKKAWQTTQMAKSDFDTITDESVVDHIKDELVRGLLNTLRDKVRIKKYEDDGVVFFEASLLWVDVDEFEAFQKEMLTKGMPIDNKAIIRMK